MAEKKQKKDRGDDKDRSHKKDRHSDRGSDRRGDDSSRRGRSRARRTETKTKSRSRDRRRRSVEALGKAVLRPASAEAATTAGGAEKRPEAMASEPAPPGKSAPVVEPDDDDEESAEEEAPRAEDAEVEDGPRSTVPKAVTVDSDDENECTASTAKAATTEGPAGLKKTSEGSERPPEPANGPRSGPGDPKTGSYKCTVCGRNVGGGLQGNFSHRRSPFHLASWIYYSTSEKKAWGQCMADAKRWSQMLWEENKTGPGDDETNVKIPEPVGQQKGKGKKPRSPPPDRADPERKRRKDDRDDPDPGSGGADSSRPSSKKDLLVEMWQATLRELR